MLSKLHTFKVIKFITRRDKKKSQMSEVNHLYMTVPEE